MLRILTDRGTEYWGKAESHDYQLYLAVNGIGHTKTKARYPQTNGICERFHKTILNEFYETAFRRKIYKTVAELQADLDEWIEYPIPPPIHMVITTYLTTRRLPIKKQQATQAKALGVISVNNKRTVHALPFNIAEIGYARSS